MFINIRGRNGAWNNGKCRWLSKHFPKEKIYSPHNDYRTTYPRAILRGFKNKICEAQQKNEKVRMIATSMGGFFANILIIKHFEIITVMINPSRLPVVTLGGQDDAPSEICRNMSIFSKNRCCMIGLRDAACIWCAQQMV